MKMTVTVLLQESSKAGVTLGAQDAVSVELPRNTCDANVELLAHNAATIAFQAAKAQWLKQAAPSHSQREGVV